MEVFDFEFEVGEVIGETFGGFFGEGGDEGSHALCGGDADFGDGVIYLTFEGADIDEGVEESGGAHDEFDGGAGLFQFECGGCGGDVDFLSGDVKEFFGAEGSVIECGGESEAVFDEGFFAGAVGLVHALDLGEGDM